MLVWSPAMLIDCELMGTARPFELRVPDVEQAWSFYRDIMGAQEVSRHARSGARSARIGFTIGRAGFLIVPDGDAETGDSRPSLALLAEEFDSTFAAILLHVRDPATVVRRALEAGGQLQPEAATRTESYGCSPVEVIIDPFGHSWAFVLSGGEISA